MIPSKQLIIFGIVLLFSGNYLCSSDSLDSYAFQILKRQQQKHAEYTKQPLVPEVSEPHEERDENDQAVVNRSQDTGAEQADTVQDQPFEEQADTAQVQPAEEETDLSGVTRPQSLPQSFRDSQEQSFRDSQETTQTHTSQRSRETNRAERAQESRETNEVQDPQDTRGQPEVSEKTASTYDSGSASGARTTETGDTKNVAEEDHVYALKGDTVTVSLQGEGWIYTGERANKEGLTFLSRDFSRTSSDFIFQVDKMDTYTLRFQKQLAATGETYVKQVKVSAVTEEEFAEYVGMGSDKGLYGTEKDTAGDYSSAERLYENGRYEEALDEYIAHYETGNREINQRIAELSLMFHKYNQAMTYWKKNLEGEGPVREKAVRGIINVALALDDQKTFDRYLDELLEISSIDIKEELLKGAEMEEEKGYLKTAVALLDEYTDRYPEDNRIDYVYFLLGKIYEKKSDIQDVERALNYYTIVTEKYPASEYWFDAEDRKKYLKRYFLQIR